MSKRVSTFFSVLFLSIIGGVVSLNSYLKSQSFKSDLSLGPWTPLPQFDNPSSSIYARAKAFKTGLLALGQAEGLTFLAAVDSTKNTLEGKNCYILEGEKPAASLFTIYTAKLQKDGTLTPIKLDPLLPTELDSYRIFSDTQSGHFTLYLSARAHARNWLSIPAHGTFVVVVTFYNSHFSYEKHLQRMSLPTIHKVV